MDTKLSEQLEEIKSLYKKLQLDASGESALRPPKRFIQEETKSYGYAWNAVFVKRKTRQ